MQVVTAREFRANQTKILSAVRDGESVMLTSRVGNFKIVPISSHDEILRRDIMTSIAEARGHLAGYTELPDARDIISNGD